MCQLEFISNTLLKYQNRTTSWKCADSKTIMFTRKEKEETYEFKDCRTEAYSIKPKYKYPVSIFHKCQQQHSLSDKDELS